MTAAAATLLIGAADVPADWAATLRTDGQAFHDQVAQNHPEPEIRVDPHLGARNDAGMEPTLQRAAIGRNYPACLWACEAMWRTHLVSAAG